jgi:hypothetical protein
MLQAPRSEVHFGWNPEKPGGGVVVGLIFLARRLNLDTEFLAAVSAEYLTIPFKRPPKTRYFHHFKTILESELRSNFRSE